MPWCISERSFWAGSNELKHAWFGCVLAKKSWVSFLCTNAFSIDLLTWLWFLENHCYRMFVFSLMNLLMGVWLISEHVDSCWFYILLTKACCCFNPLSCSEIHLVCVLRAGVMMLHKYICLAILCLARNLTDDDAYCYFATVIFVQEIPLVVFGLLIFWCCIMMFHWPCWLIVPVWSWLCDDERC